MTNKEKLMQVFGLYEDQINVYCNPCSNCSSAGKFCNEYDKKMHANRFGCGLWLNSEYKEPSEITLKKAKMFKHGGDILKISKELENIGIQLTMEEIESKWGKFSQEEYNASWISPEYYFFLRFLNWYDKEEERIMSVETIKVCKCDICGKVLPEETGHLRWQANLKLGSNVRDADSVIFEDVCDECVNAIRNVIQERSNKKETQCEEKTYANEWMVTYADIR